MNFSKLGTTFTLNDHSRELLTRYLRTTIQNQVSRDQLKTTSGWQLYQEGPYWIWFQDQR